MHPTPLSPFTIGSILALAAGLAIFLGALLANAGLVQKLKSHELVSHALTAMGGGALMSAIAFVLVPEGMHGQSKVSVLVSFILGAVGFMGADWLIARSKSKLGQFLAMLLDFIPESITLGVLIAHHKIDQAIFVAAIIAVQNFPEGYCAFEEMTEGPPSDTPDARKKLLRRFFAVSLCGPVFMLLGAKVLINHPQLMSTSMTFCAGGILYLLFQDIAPKVALENSQLPPLAAALGFSVGLAGFLWG